jgi:hypothetical protein
MQDVAEKLTRGDGLSVDQLIDDLPAPKEGGGFGSTQREIPDTVVGTRGSLITLRQ